MKLIVGLGNPGTKYEHTRHNVGFWVIDKVAQRNNLVLDESVCSARVGRGQSRGEPIVLAKPQTFMNRSGQSIAALLRELQLGLADLLVVYDDLDLPVTRLRVRSRGSAGGHRGIQSIIEQVGSTEFSRVRIGIGRPPEGVEVISYVLEPLDQECLQNFDAAVEGAAAAVETFVEFGVERAMQEHNASR